MIRILGMDGMIALGVGNDDLIHWILYSITIFEGWLWWLLTYVYVPP